MSKNDFNIINDSFESELNQNLRKNKSIKIHTQDSLNSSENSQLGLSESERQEYRQKFNNLTKEIGYNQRLNKLLLKKCSDYFRRKKLDHVFSEVEDSQKIEYQFQKLLNQYSEAKESFDIDQKQIQDYLVNLKLKYENKLQEVNQRFLDLRKKKSDCVEDLIVRESRRNVFKRITEKLFKQEKLRFDQMNEYRFEFLKFQNSVKKLQKEINEFEHFRQGLRLTDFDHLQSKNENLLSKIEEKNDSLARLKDIYEENSVLLLFFHEKIQLNSMELERLKNNYEDIENVWMKLRKDLHEVKKQKEIYRKNIDDLNEQCGLLQHPKLLNYMQKVIDDFDNAQEQYLQLKYQNQSRRKTIQRLTKMLHEI